MAFLIYFLPVIFISVKLLEQSELAMDQYETLPKTYSVWIHIMAGSAAGLAEHCVMFPVDSVKTRMQSLCPCPETSCPTPIHGVASMIKREGWLRPLRGVNAIAAGSIPAHAFYFTVYEKMRNYLTGNTRTHWNTLSYGISGIAATIMHDLIMNPAEVVKQRMQMANSPYGGSIECIRCIYRKEGITAFYRSYATQLFMNVPFQALHFMSYEFWQQLLNKERKYDPKSHTIAGGLAGGLAAAITTPLDCIKTVLNTQQSPAIRLLVDNNRMFYVARDSYKGFWDAITSIYVNRGLQGFFYGLPARVLYQMPATALSWTVYELFKFLLDR